MGGGVALCDFENGLFGGRVADDERWLGIADEIIHLVKAIGRVHGQKDKAAAQTGKINAKRFRGFLYLQRHAIPGLEPALRKKRREPRGEGKEIVRAPVAQTMRPIRRFENDPRAILRERVFDQRKKGMAHGAPAARAGCVRRGVYSRNPRSGAMPGMASPF